MKTKQRNILLADDDKDDRYFFDKALKEIEVSANLITVNDGEALMAYLSENSEQLPDILFLDINMPGKNGLECLQGIQCNEKLKLLSVVMFSTSNDSQEISMLFKSGAHVYIHKPSDFSELKQVISHALPIADDKMVPASKVKYILNA